MRAWPHRGSSFFEARGSARNRRGLTLSCPLRYVVSRSSARECLQLKSQRFRCTSALSTSSLSFAPRADTGAAYAGLSPLCGAKEARTCGHLEGLEQLDSKPMTCVASRSRRVDLHVSFFELAPVSTFASTACRRLRRPTNPWALGLPEMLTKYYQKLCKCVHARCCSSAWTSRQF